jgi:hypothetical protein
MNERIRELLTKTNIPLFPLFPEQDPAWVATDHDMEKFAELIVKEMCGLMEQAEDDAYHCFEPSERPTEYMRWLRYWLERFEEHFGVNK